MFTKPNLLIKEVHDKAVLDNIYQLRVEAWRMQLTHTTSIEAWEDEFDPIAQHWGCFDEDRLVAAARLSVHQDIQNVPDADAYEGVITSDAPSPIASLNRLVVHHDYRGKGIAKKLDTVRLARAREIGCKCVIGATCDIRRGEQLKAQGFMFVGEGKATEKGFLAGSRNMIWILYL